MNSSRPHLEPIPAHTEFQYLHRVRDQRILVLLLIGLLIIIAHLLHNNFSNRVHINPTASTLLWLSDNNGRGKVYSVADSLLPPLCDNFTNLYSVLGLTNPPAHDLAAIDSFLANKQNTLQGLVVMDAASPLSVPVPAILSSFLFEKISINEADEELLVTIPGIGPRMAEQLLATRSRKGRIQNKEELLEIPGIHFKKLQQITAHLSFD